jgi:hypothetical protein
MDTSAEARSIFATSFFLILVFIGACITIAMDHPANDANGNKIGS